MSRYSSTPKVLVIVIMLVFALFFGGIGIASLVADLSSYDLPIYISEEFTVKGYATYTVSGKITNRTDEDVTIDKLVVALNGGSRNENYYAEWKDQNIVIPANETVELSESGLSYQNEYGGQPSGQLKSAYVKECIVNGENWDIRVSENGTDFERENGNTPLSILGIIGGVALVIASVVILVRAIKEDDWYF